MAKSIRIALIVTALLLVSLIVCAVLVPVLFEDRIVQRLRVELNERLDATGKQLRSVLGGRDSDVLLQNRKRVGEDTQPHGAYSPFCRRHVVGAQEAGALPDARSIYLGLH